MGRKGRSKQGEPELVDAVAFRRSLLRWYDRSHRDLPWRTRRHDPYAVWISEAMLQQTRADVVRGRFEAFLERFPDLGRLAEAATEEVVAAWSGLGYYRRARNLHAAARSIIRDHGGAFPRDPAAARSLPGVGRYTAHAVLSIAYGEPLAVVDGNVTRVLSRLELLVPRPLGRVQAEADRLLDPRRPGDANQALMELGATVCLPASPRCAACPLRRRCSARRTDQVAHFPPPSARPAPTRIERSLWLLLDRRGRLWLEHRCEAPLAGLWMLPWRESSEPIDGAQQIGTVTHAIMNRRYRCTVFRISADPERIPGRAAGAGRWVARKRIAGLPHSSLLPKALELAGL